MPTIQVDFDVFKALTARRASEDVTENDVLRQILGLPRAPVTRSAGTRHKPGDWVAKGVRLPQGTEARGRYKGQLYLAEVREGALLLDGHRYDSPSAAAMAITRHPTNGWTFWEVKLPGTGEWRMLRELREST